MNVDDILAKASLPERTERVCLNAALAARYDEARTLAAAAQTASDARIERDAETMAQRARVQELVDAAEQLRSEVDQEAVALQFRALPFTAYNQLVIAHPPRKDHRTDGTFGYNTLTFFPELIRSCLVDPVVTDEQWARLLGVMNDKTFDRLAGAALQVNRGQDANVPF